ncbi:methylated-DNA--[protein]-cysteine S-methyltransferase [Mycetocola reblochoni]|uniref:Methylated-DNA--protein-cysteine methyltransferase n=2 Tax=Mycetocola reblochoni TaxID=331618 RepID=A0A1R4IUQ4_9MICO|nr:methylated-DNA--[protein]-cysteine S-methyltransferase [Mycetocola reblochoni]RLP71017.1 methylated-DNA--[protein]-cysteine S-methyltransferase [Mycetocola reblochoni]SJN23590.1 Methylated-DNA--protein-cysteine methyltransferase [Mycetocola reblochoni REB411]
MQHTIIDSPVGELDLVSHDGALAGVYFRDHRHAPSDRGERVSLPLAASVLQLAAEQLAEYFAGHRRAFTLTHRVDGTEFQRRVWDELERIPFGSTASYGELAAKIGSPAAVRAVGLANGRNPLSIVVPCHRVVGATGQLTGYGGGVEVKRRLLDMERLVVDPPLI